jgi:methyltransferase (TIGR00027 family)
LGSRNVSRKAKTITPADIKQVVLVASGMDARGFRLKWPDDVVVYEVDHDALHEEKPRRLTELGAEPAVERREVRADLAGEWLAPLEQAGSTPPHRRCGCPKRCSSS